MRAIDFCRYVTEGLHWVGLGFVGTRREIMVDGDGEEMS